MIVSYKMEYCIDTHKRLNVEILDPIIIVRVYYDGLPTRIEVYKKV